jgi:hypothetical protein
LINNKSSAYQIVVDSFLLLFQNQHDIKTRLACLTNRLRSTVVCSDKGDVAEKSANIVIAPALQKHGGQHGRRTTESFCSASN